MLFNLSKKNKFLIVFLFILALLPRIVLILFSEQVLAGDEPDYNQLAVSILEGREYHSNFPLGFTNARAPLYPLFIAIIYLFSDYSIFAVKLAQAVLGAGICIIVFFIAEELFKDRRISCGAGLISALYPLFISITASLITETLYTFLLASAMFFLLKGHSRPELKTKFLSGLFLGLAALTKPVILAFIPFLLLWLILFSPETVSSRFKNTAIIMFFTALAIAPWTIRNYKVFNEFIPISTGSGVTFYGYNNEDTLAKIYDPVMPVHELPLSDEQKREMSLLSESERDKYLCRLGWGFALLHPKDFLEIRLISLGQFWHLWPAGHERFTEYYSQLAKQNALIGRFKGAYFLWFCKILYHMPYNILFLGMLAGFINYFKGNREEWRKSLLFFLLIAAMSLVYSIHGGDRYRMPIDPYVFVLGLRGILLFCVRK